ncbi:MAG TPA: amylo-alpha-1,6-glucosidase [Thermoanaerobaculia bacterium]|nr:amylo-alpha-1,6-glucosidase [Thermoanaerobaculia bacterium]
MDQDAEWLEADGLGGFASGTVGGVRTRRYHALLLVAAEPPAGRVVLVNGCDAWVSAGGRTFALSSQLYMPGVVEPDGREHLEDFAAEPWPRWTWNLAGMRVVQEVFVPRGLPLVALSWRMLEGPKEAKLVVRPFLSGRDCHGLHHENTAFRFVPERQGARRIWRPYPGLPGIAMVANGAYEHDPLWYRGFLYEQERARGLDAVEDLASPGTLRWDLARGEAIWIVAAEGTELPGSSPAACMGICRGDEERRRRRFASPLRRAADAYLARRGPGLTVVAGYPWFADRGRDTFVALRGLALATGRRAEALAVLLTWAAAVSEGLVPSHFADRDAVPERDSVDGSLWYAAAAGELLAGAGAEVAAGERRRLAQAVEAVLDAYARGTRHGIHADSDGLLAAGEAGSRLTWMDAAVDGRAVTPRVGKPVEVQALWINGLAVGAALAGEPGRWRTLLEQASASFAARFWNEAAGCLYDVVDVDHHSGAVDPTLRANQIFAVGGLPRMLLPAERARRVVDTVEARLWTPLGLRSLAPGEPGYHPRCAGDPRARAGAYHQGTVWPWLAGPFVEAWVRVRGGTREARREARERFLAPLLDRLDGYGLGHLPEIADGDLPHTPRGCPFQAWSMGELLRLDLEVLAEER